MLLGSSARLTHPEAFAACHGVFVPVQTAAQQKSNCGLPNGSTRVRPRIRFHLNPHRSLRSGRLLWSCVLRGSRHVDPSRPRVSGAPTAVGFETATLVTNRKARVHMVRERDSARLYPPSAAKAEGHAQVTDRHGGGGENRVSNGLSEGW